MTVIIPSILAVLGYLLALNLPGLLQPGVIIGVVLYLKSEHFQRAELLQLLYMWWVIAFLAGWVVGLIVSLIAHWDHPYVGIVTNAIQRAFTP